MILKIIISLEKLVLNVSDTLPRNIIFFEYIKIFLGLLHGFRWSLQNKYGQN